jgi:hypothetical protein
MKKPYFIHLGNLRMKNEKTLLYPPGAPPQKGTLLNHTITEQIYGETPQKGTLLRVSKMGLKVW